MSRQSSLGTIAPKRTAFRRGGVWSWGLLLGWISASAGYYGAWIAHPTAALTLSGADMAEFVKFLPSVLDGSLQVFRQLFYLPPLVVGVTIALLIASPRLLLPVYVRAIVLVLAIPVTLQLLPPAWSIASLRSPEFMLQTLAMVGCWLLLAISWLLGRLPILWSGVGAAVLGLASLALCAWHMSLVKPAIDPIYGIAPGIGWGFWLCMTGLAVVSLAGLGLGALGRDPRGRS